MEALIYGGLALPIQNLESYEDDNDSLIFFSQHAIYEGEEV